jgi:hypothetical protein
VTTLRLPVSGIDVLVRLPTGAEDVFLVEAGAPDIRVALALLDRVVQRTDDAPIEWLGLSPTDVDVLLLRLRQRVIGDLVTTDLYCAAPSCHERVDITFSIDAFIEHQAPAVLAGAAADGWFQLADGVEFRLPRAADQLAIACETDPETALVQRCMRGVLSPALRERAEAAMEAIAPSLYTELEGSCPACGAMVTADFDPLQYTLRELRDQAARVFEEVCVIARHTHWSEAAILAMPTTRRLRYADVVQEAP